MAGMDMMLKSMLGFDPSELKAKATEIAQAIAGFINRNDIHQKEVMAKLEEISSRLSTLENGVLKNGAEENASGNFGGDERPILRIANGGNVDA